MERCAHISLAGRCQKCGSPQAESLALEMFSAITNAQQAVDARVVLEALDTLDSYIGQMRSDLQTEL